VTLFSLAGSRNCVNRTVKPENDLERKMTATSGRKCLEQYGRFSRVGSWGKTFSALLIGTGDWYSTKCKLTWKMRGTSYNRMYFQLVPSTPRTEGIEFGLLPTPTTQEPSTPCEITETGRRMTKDGKSSHSLNLGRLAGMLPTPQTQGLKIADEQGKTRFLDSKLLPSPHLSDGMGSQLNPQYVEAMMGFPENWTLSPFLNGGKNP
jgi:hypothetical protein